MHPPVVYPRRPQVLYLISVCKVRSLRMMGRICRPGNLSNNPQGQATFEYCYKSPLEGQSWKLVTCKIASRDETSASTWSDQIPPEVPRLQDNISEHAGSYMKMQLGPNQKLKCLFYFTVWPEDVNGGKSSWPFKKIFSLLTRCEEFILTCPHFISKIGIPSQKWNKSIRKANRKEWIRRWSCSLEDEISPMILMPRLGPGNLLRTTKVRKVNILAATIHSQFLRSLLPHTMARKKKTPQPDTNPNTDTVAVPSNASSPPSTLKAPTSSSASASSSSTKKPAHEPSTSALIICRNKWVYALRRHVREFYTILLLLSSFGLTLVFAPDIGATYLRSMAHGSNCPPRSLSPLLTPITFRHFRDPSTRPSSMIWLRFAKP